MNHKELDSWKKSIDLVLDIYRLTAQFPREEAYGLTMQPRRASVSIPSNIAEGAAKHSDKDNIRFLNISLGSLSEMETQMIIAEKLNYIPDSDIYTKIKDVRMLIMGMKRYLSQKK